MLWEWLRTAVLFPCGGVVRRGDGYACEADPPLICPVCDSSAGKYHAHGSFSRWLKTIAGASFIRIRLFKPRFLCLSCGHTFSLSPPETIPYQRVCVVTMVAFLWCYLAAAGGLHNCLDPELSEHVSVRNLARHVKRAKRHALDTQQAIREVVVETIEPRPMEELFPGGLDPPETLRRKQCCEPEESSILWRALHLVRSASTTLTCDPRALLAWANQRSRLKKRRFLI
jgi:transposase-like protein